MNIKEFNDNNRKPFEEIYNDVISIHDTENTYLVQSAEEVVCDTRRYTSHGLSTLGKQLGFPSTFIEEVFATNPSLANDIIEDRATHYFNQKGNPFFAREFTGKVCGVVSNKYNFFDDDEAMKIVASSSLADKRYAATYITPERLHLRAIDDTPFSLDGDNSPLYFCYFIDNSMVGISSFKVQLGIYRQVCTNGLILPTREFLVCKQIHRGNKDIAAEFNETVAFLDSKKDNIKEMLLTLTNEDARVMAMKEDIGKKYISNSLVISKKETDKIIELFNNTYDGHTKWGFVNAITEFARDVKNVEKRIFLEKKALEIA